MRIALGVEYDGARYSGWQSQLHNNTVQDTLETALARIACAAVRVTCAGRTDAGVHAAAQVVHFDAVAERPLSAWVRGTNAHLPNDVAVRWACAVPDEFHARFSAVSRSYRYVLCNHAVRPALLHGRVGWFHLSLELETMRAGATALVGKHDFSAFRSAECQAKSPVKQLHRADIARHGDYLVFEFVADAFLQHMVRNMVGALVAVGKGSHEPGWIAALLHQRDRKLAAPTFSPAGLYLHGIEYDARWQLPMNGRIIAPFELIDS